MILIWQRSYTLALEQDPSQVAIVSRGALQDLGIAVGLLAYPSIPLAVLKGDFVVNTEIIHRIRVVDQCFWGLIV